MKKSRLPRKEKKLLNRGFWLYSADEKGDSLVATARIVGWNESRNAIAKWAPVELLIWYISSLINPKKS